MAGRAFDAVMFDLDDTLIDWWGSLTRCLESFADDDDVAAAHAYIRQNFWESHPDHDFVWHRNTWQLWEARQRLWHDVFAHRHEDDRRIMLDRFEENLWVGFFPDVVPLLDHLVHEIRLAVLTNNEYVEREIKRLRLHDWFEFALFPGAPLKPDPAAFLAGCERLGLEPSRVAYVGDSVRADVLGAAAAGLTPIWIDRWNDPWPDRPTHVQRITSFDELPEVLGVNVPT